MRSAARARGRGGRAAGPRLGGARGVLFTILAVVALATGAAAHEAVVGRLARLAPGVFQLRRAAVIGARMSSKAELEQRIGLHRGASRAAIDCDAIETRLAEHPLIAQARVSRALPGILLVRLIERRPVARVRGPGGEWWVDVTGMPFEPGPGAGVGSAEAPAGTNTAPALPLLVTESAVVVGTRSAALASAIGQVRLLGAAGLVVSEWHLEKRIAGERAPTALARLRGPIPPLLLGEADRGAQIHTLARALAIGQIGRAGVIDLRFRDQAIFWPDRPDVGAAGKWAPPEG